MNHELYTYLQKMHSFVQSQEKRILELEKTVKSLSKELSDVKSRPPVQIDTIEYKFDQLKVETLEGTLNIGLNPSDLEGIEDFEVKNKGISTNNSPKQKMKRTMEIEDEIYRYIDNDLPTLIRHYENDLRLKVEDTHIEFIKDDIKKQLPQRIGHYFSQVPQNERSPEAERKVTDKIVEQMKRDIENAVLAFLRNLPNEKKVRNDESSDLQ
jgi:spore germination protein PC